MEAIWVVVIVALVGPVVLAIINGLIQSRMRREDWARQDDVAKKLLEANERAATLAAKGNEQLGEIHTLVNSNLTAAKQAELAATESTLAVLREFATYRAERGGVMLPEYAERVRATEARVRDLLAQLGDRIV